MPFSVIFLRNSSEFFRARVRDALDRLLEVKRLDDRQDSARTISDIRDRAKTKGSLKTDWVERNRGFWGLKNIPLMSQDF